MESNVFNLAEVAAKHGVQEIVLPGWDSQTPFVCRAKRPSLYNMASAGLVPNPLLSAVQTLFSRRKEDIDAVAIDKQAKAMIQMAKYALVEPTYDQLIAAGLEMTDAQLMNIYVYAVGGAAMLEPFRTLLRGGAGEPGEPVQDAAQPADGG